MKFYSEVLDKMFDSEDELREAEQKKRNEDKANDVIATNLKEKVDNLTKEFEEAVDKATEILRQRDAAVKELHKFTKYDKSNPEEVEGLAEILDWLFS